MSSIYLTVLAYAMIIAFMALIMTKRMSVLAALIIVPIVFGLIGGYGPKLGAMMMDGVKSVAPTGIMLMFAIIYFSIMSDTGLFDPIIRRIVGLVHGDPTKIAVGTAVLALLVSLDGDGSTTYLIVTSAFLPLYERLGMSRLLLASISMQAVGIMNIIPWGGPTARAASALNVPVSDVFVPLIPGIVTASLWVVAVAWFLGSRERTRIGIIGAFDPPAPENGVKRSNIYLGFNFLLTLGLLVALVYEVLPLPILFMVACALALAINFPKIEDQRARVAAHAYSALAIASVVFAAGILVGVLSGTKMLDAMAQSVVSIIPDFMGPYLAIVTAILSIPLTFFLSNDAFYYGVLPILNQAAGAYGITPAEMARASLIGQPVHLMSPLVPSLYLLVGLCRVELGEHQQFTLKWSLGSCGVMLVVSILFGVIPLGR